MSAAPGQPGPAGGFATVPPVGALPGVTSPNLHAPSIPESGGRASVLSLFGVSGDDPPSRNGDDRSTRRVGGGLGPAASGGGRRTRVFVAVAAALLLFVAVGAGLMLWSGGSEPVARRDPAPAHSEPARHGRTPTAEPSPGGSASVSPSESPVRPQPGTPTDGPGDGSADGDSGDGSGGNGSGGDDGRPGIGDPMPTMPRHG